MKSKDELLAFWFLNYLVGLSCGVILLVTVPNATLSCGVILGG